MKQLIVAAILLVCSGGIGYSDEVPSIAVIKRQGMAPYDKALWGFKKHMKEQGVDASVTEYGLEGKTGRELENLSKEIRSHNPKLVLTLGTPATRFARETMGTIPVVFAMVLSPERSGILPPGVSMDVPFETKLTNLKKILPRAKRIGMVYSSDTISSYEEAANICAKLGFHLSAKRIDSQRDFSDAFKDMAEDIDSFFMIPDSRIYFPKLVEYLLLESLRDKIPVVGLSSAYAKAGALVAFDCDYEDLGKQAGQLALRILAGEASALTRIVRPREVHLSLNLLAAKRMEVAIDPTITSQAHKVFGK
ncbi:MAG: ABC transporter substrate-binding protein [Thermodesulfobacteriota bacterium]|nr:ABC transporter substrate-binding protein [Thermodesulfobacteriota bacterium]